MYLCNMQLDTYFKNLNIQSLNAMQEATWQATEDFHDTILLSPTGSGKTLAFLFPILRNLKKDVKGVQALIMVPSRELALQIEEVFKKMGTGFKINSTYGGHATKIELNNFNEPPAVLVGTPGRIAFHLRNENFSTAAIQTLALDEFDKALEFGFENDMTYIIQQLVGLRQRILTSATALKKIPDFTGIVEPGKLNFLKDEEVTPDLTFKKLLAAPEEKLEVVLQLICKLNTDISLIFCNHRDAVDRISETLRGKGIAHESFHGGMLQDERERALLKFRNGSSRILLTTDLAARGLDIPEVDNIIHYQLPPKEDAFIHRNGRTARMNAKGTVYLIMTADESFPFLEETIEVEVLEKKYALPQHTVYDTVYISVGKKDKVNKVDIVGYLIKTGGLEKEDIGLIMVKDTAAYVAIKYKKVIPTLKKLADQKLKGKKVKMERAK